MAKKTFTEGTWKKDPWFRSLCAALAACTTEEQVASFLRDVATLSELKALSERLEVAKLVANGTTYRVIMEKTGASTTTVTRVARFVQDGEGGYQRFLRSSHHTSESLVHASKGHHHAAAHRGKSMASKT
ncbi:MAG: YerC/YecD family TrpR-related protein [Candidatus Peregrinibacteria bacterium]